MKLNFIKMSPCQNTTVLVTEYCPKKYYIAVAAQIMSYDSLCAEQVGFIVPPKSADSVLGMEMAGGEFCGNASLCAYLNHGPILMIMIKLWLSLNQKSNPMPSVLSHTRNWRKANTR